MSLDKGFSPAAIEQRWYQQWEDSGAFAPQGEGESYTILLPPPNVTGTLHMGHAFQHTLMDILIRRARMQGRRVLWQGGTDHAGIATQMVVERQLVGTTRQALGREAFLERVWQWKHSSGATIERQMRRMGVSLHWPSSCFTMDEKRTQAVTEAFVRLYQQGLIYRGQRLVNWDPVLGTAVSDLEVVASEEAGSLWHLRYRLVGDESAAGIVVATTRPETLFGDQAVAVHPSDERYAHLIGRLLHLPLTGRQIPIVADDSVEPEFGTGAVKITPAHDFNDYATGQRHGLSLLNIFTAEAKLNDNVPPPYRGLERSSARQAVLAQLEAEQLLVASLPHLSKIPRGDRSGAMLEPWLTDQWFMNMDSLARQALAALDQGQLAFVPEAWGHTYRQWLDNIQPWCLSRQIWWGHRIPAWFTPDGRTVVAHNLEQARQISGCEDLEQEQSVLDTWFSSALWPMSTLGWPEATPELQRHLPSQVLVTGFDIIFFWVARMVMMTQQLTSQVPFHQVYITGLVRDAEGQKMSKSKGNILDPIDLVDGIDVDALVAKRTTGLMIPEKAADIARATKKEFAAGIAPIGADALRFTFAALASHGRDIKFDVQRAHGYRNFCNKLWNSARFVLLKLENVHIDPKATLSDMDQWLWQHLQLATQKIDQAIDEYRFDIAASVVYQLIWDQFCDRYVEAAKLALADPKQKDGTAYTLAAALEVILRLAHPIMPFITEELWQKVVVLTQEKPCSSIMLSPWPTWKNNSQNDAAFMAIEKLWDMVAFVRRNHSDQARLYGRGLSIEQQQRLSQLTRISVLTSDSDIPPLAVVFEAPPCVLWVVDDLAADKAAKEQEKRRAEMEKLAALLNNPQFLERAPQQVVAQERKRYELLRQSLNNTEADHGHR